MLLLGPIITIIITTAQVWCASLQAGGLHEKTWNLIQTRREAYQPHAFCFHEDLLIPLERGEAYDLYLMGRKI